MGMDQNKAPGEDGKTIPILKQAFQKFPLLFTATYNSCLIAGCCPKLWKKARIIPITKPGKAHSLETSKYRPISLINVGGKVLEKLITRIQHHSYSNNLFNEHQHSFRTIEKHNTCSIVTKGTYRRIRNRTGYSSSKPGRELRVWSLPPAIPYLRGFNVSLQ